MEIFNMHTKKQAMLCNITKILSFKLTDNIITKKKAVNIWSGIWFTKDIFGYQVVHHLDTFQHLIWEKLIQKGQIKYKIDV